MLKCPSALFFLLIAAAWALACAAASAEGQVNRLVNPGFDRDLSGWDIDGEAAIETAAPLDGSGSLKLGPGKAAVSQRYAIGGLRIVLFGAMMRAGRAATIGGVRARCYDAQGRLLMDVRLEIDPKKTSPQGSWTAVYFKTQAHTASLLLSIEKETDAPGYLYADSARLEDYDYDRAAHAPRCDLRRYMQPLWQGNMVCNETVLLESDAGKLACGRLLFVPKHILSVRDYGLTTTYAAGKDYTLDGRTITCTPGSHMPTVKDADFPKGVFPWYTVQGKPVVVTYTHAESWRGPVPHYAGDEMPRTLDKLRRRLPLTVVAYGDSITLGDDVSGFVQIPPYMPTWAELFTRSLKQSFGDDQITLYNAALGGATSSWGLDNAESAVASLDPDLVIIAFGMNDFWSTSPQEFRKNIQGIIERVRAHRPQAEFLLIASMRFDPAYTSDPAYSGNMAGYATALRSLTGTGVQTLDMNAISGALYAAKKPKDLIANPMHPNDFLARWYAQGLAAMLTPPATARHRPSSATTAPAHTPAKPRRTSMHHFSQPRISILGIACGLAALLLFSFAAAASATDYYVSPDGSDANPGTQARPWQSLAKVNATHLNAGDRVLLASGATFHGGLVLDPTEAGTPGRPITICASGRERATILSDGQTAISAAGGGIDIHNLTLKGAAAKPDKVRGIAFYTDDAHGAKSRGIHIDNVEITGFGGDAISIGAGGKAGAGYEDVRIIHANIHDNFGTGIITFGPVSAEQASYAHKDFYIADCTLAHNHSGTGMVLSGIDHGLAEFCRADDNDGKGGGVGIWAYAARDVTFRYCISSGTTTNNGGDGCGFDLDGACVDCAIESCLSYGNDGCGYMHCDYPSATPTTGNVIKDSISINDGRKSKGDSYGFGFCTWGTGLDNCTISGCLSLVTVSDPHERQNGIYWVGYIPESADNARFDHGRQHVSGCVFRDNIALVAGSGIAYVTDDMPAVTPANVRFEGNIFRSADGASPVFRQDKTRYATVDKWRAATGQKLETAATPAPSLPDIGPGLAATLSRITDPRSLPRLGILKSLKARDATPSPRG